MLISETHLNSRSFLRIHGYSIYAANQPGDCSFAGACIIIKSNIDHHPIVFHRFNYGQIVGVKIRSDFGDYVIAATYIRPSLHPDLFTATELDRILHSLGPKFLIAGDWNAKHPLWGCNRSCRRGRFIRDRIMSSSLNVCATGDSTFFPYDRLRIPNALDFGIYGGLPSSAIKIESRFELSSDHIP